MQSNIGSGLTKDFAIKFLERMTNTGYILLSTHTHSISNYTRGKQNYGSTREGCITQWFDFTFNLFIIIIRIASLARDVAPIDHDHAAQHCPTAIGWMYPSASTA